MSVQTTAFNDLSARAEAQLYERPNWIRRLLRVARQKPLGTVGAVIVIVFLVTASIAPTISPYDARTTVAKPLQSPDSDHWLGTDAIGHDVFSRVLEGSQISLVIALTITAIFVVLGTSLGLIAGYFQGPMDYIIQRSGEIWTAFPNLIALLLIVSILGPPTTTGGTLLNIAWDLRNLIFALSLGALFGGSRIIRGVTLSLKQTDYVLAARTIGAGDTRIIFKHLLPNVLPFVIVGATSGLAAVILAEAALSFLGLGVAPGTPSWGQDLSGRNRQFFRDAPWVALAPGVAISLCVVGFNLMGDALRDVLDPRLRQ
jgi:peptide/nickel transport system permease protein